MDFRDSEKVKDLSFHCMLCNKCTEICPFGIDGRNDILEGRRKFVQEHQGKLAGYLGIQKEKIDYKFKNYRNAKSSVLFPGCNYPSLYPETMKKLTNLMQEHDIGVVYDCCGKPVGELGLQREEQVVLEELNRRFRVEGIQEIIVLCPNCFYFLEGKLEVQITTIYKKLQEIGGGTPVVPRDDFHIFPPCPDRKKQNILKDMEVFLPEKYTMIGEIQCCGLGGVAPVKEKEFPKIMARGMQAYKENKKIQEAYVYCSSCAGSFERNEVEGIYHILNEILGSKERPDVRLSFLNRVKTKFK